MPPVCSGGVGGTTSGSLPPLGMPYIPHQIHTYLLVFPHPQRRGGRDHIWLTAADEGACWMPTEIYQNSIILTHWGRWGCVAGVGENGEGHKLVGLARPRRLSKEGTVQRGG